MNIYTVDEVIAAWTEPPDKRQAEAPEDYQESIRLTDLMLQLLAEGQPVSARDFSRAASIPEAEVQDFFTEYQKSGGELNGDGRLVGAALTLNLTPHRFVIRGRTLYTWCALDALFVPGLIHETALVYSVCPTTGDEIQLTVTPEGVTAYHPKSTVLSMTIPGISCKTKRSETWTGPESDTCSQIHFFASRAAAENWLTDHPDVVVFTVEEAWRLAESNWLARRSS